MKTALLLSLLVLVTYSLKAEDTQTSRTLLRFGFLMTKGDDTGWDQLGPGFSLSQLTYFNAASPDGWYYGILGSAFSREAGNVILADTRLVTLGWRGNPAHWFGPSSLPLQLDVGLAPTLGSRIQKKTVLGTAYAGLGVTVGFGLSVIDGQDLGLSWEPVFPFASWGGGSHAPYRGYSDFVLSWTVKTLCETRALKW